MQNPKFEAKVQRNIIAPSQVQAAKAGMGIVLSYNPENNTANIQMSKPNSTDLGQVYSNVMCPTTIGVQTTAPEPGRPCWVAFKGSGNTSDYYPVVTHFFNHVYNQIDFAKQSASVNNTPRYILST